MCSDVIEMKIHIYKIYFPTSKKYYIGQTIAFEKRMHQHIEAESVVGRAMRKHDDWQISILHTVKTKAQANLVEIEEIRNYNSVSPNGYNLTHGGEGGICSEETKAKISASMKGRHLSEETKSKLRGRVHSEEAKVKMKGRVCSEETRAKLRGRRFSKEHRAKIGAKLYGRRHSEETRAKMSASQKGCHVLKMELYTVKL